ncbi:MAG: hypothetical protein MSD59_09040 [Parabacteroides merdae]|nr:hypothetical protein [Parabacteroides merdae]MCI6571925.1 hypothetical protein [Parabacteroides merdae]MCI7459838.1 hypothetical protein [Parabacteroides merdae]
MSLQIGTRQSEDLDFMKWRTCKSEKMEVLFHTRYRIRSIATCLFCYRSRDRRIY